MKLSIFSILFTAIILMSFSCQQKNADEYNQVLTYSIDTVIIDSKGRILNVSGYMDVSDLDDHKETFFLYNHHDLSIDEINLDKKEFVKTVSLDAEGPNGVGPYIFGLQFLEDSLMFAKSVPFSSIIDRNGNVVQKVNWLTAKDSNGIQFDNPPPRSELVANTKDWTVVGTNLNFREKTALLGVFSVRDNIVKNIEIDPKNSFKNYFLTADNSFYDPWVFLRSNENYISVSQLYSNEIILINPEGEIVKVVQYEPKMTPSRANVPEILTGTREEIRKEQQKLLEQVRFQPPVWDSEYKRYFRLSAKRIFTDESENDESSQLSKTKVFLSVFDVEFNLISEVELTELYDENYKYFAKDGKLWVCQSFSDELGFLVFEF